MGLAYYNENDPKVASWLKELVAEGLIARGVVDTRDIRDVRPRDLQGFAQCHFFAGIGAWSYALRLAGWPDDRPVWTGSCPCQPFSTAGKGTGLDDERHLWPAWHHLIRHRRPPVVLGEQVASRLGLWWFDLVQADLQGEGYAVAGADICAAGVGAPHIRQRLWFMAHSDGPGQQTRGSDRVRDAGTSPQAPPAPYDGSTSGLGHSIRHGLQVSGQEALQRAGRRQEGYAPLGPSPTSGFWAAADWLPCRDGKARPVEPSTFPLAHGAPARVGRLRGYGNAIVGPLAAKFIEVCKEVLPT